MKLALVGMGFHTAVASLIHNLKEKGIEVIVLEQEEKEEIIESIKIPITAIDIPYIDVSIDDLIIIKKQSHKYEKAFHHTNNRPHIGNRNVLLQRRHVPTNRGK